MAALQQGLCPDGMMKSSDESSGRVPCHLTVIGAEADGFALAVGQQQAVTLRALGHPDQPVPRLHRRTAFYRSMHRTSRMRRKARTSMHLVTHISLSQATPGTHLTASCIGLAGHASPCSQLVV